MRSELIALLERAAGYLLVGGTQGLAGSTGSHTDVRVCGLLLTSYVFALNCLRESATALQAAVVQPHRAYTDSDYALRWLQDSNLLPPVQLETIQ